MNQTSLTTESAECISALCDGQLPVEAFAQTVGELLNDAQAQRIWLSYHVVGDVLRSAELAPRTSDLAFLTRLEQRLAAEPAPLGVPMHPELASPVPRHSANASVFHWKALAGLACAALVAVVGLEMIWTIPGSATVQVAKVPAPARPQTLLEVPVADLGVMVRDPRLDELLDAHRQLGGHSALQMPSGFLRNATYEGAAR